MSAQQNLDWRCAVSAGSGMIMMVSAGTGA
jgi:hypothetical protein